MNNRLGDLICIRLVMVYLNDILIFGICLKEHRWLVKEVLKRLQFNDLYTKAEKCFFEQSSIKYLGIIILENKVQIVMINLIVSRCSTHRLLLCFILLHISNSSVSASLVGHVLYSADLMSAICISHILLMVHRYIYSRYSPVFPMLYQLYYSLPSSTLNLSLKFLLECCNLSYFLTS